MAPPEDPESCRCLPEYTIASFIQNFRNVYTVSHIGVYSKIIITITIAIKFRYAHVRLTFNSPGSLYSMPIVYPVDAY